MKLDVSCYNTSPASASVALVVCLPAASVVVGSALAHKSRGYRFDPFKEVRQCWGAKHRSHAPSSTSYTRPWVTCIEILMHVKDPIAGQSYS